MQWLLLAGAGCAGCRSDDGAIADGGPDGQPDVVVVDTSVDAQDTSPPCTQKDPAYLPAGWVRYDDYAPCTGFYVPSEKQYLPPPIAWEPCEGDAGVGGCQKIKVNWSPLPGGYQGIDADAALDANGKVIILTSRSFGDAQGNQDHWMSLVAEADGPVRSAVMTTAPSRFNAGANPAPAFSPPYWILRVLENSGFVGGGYLGGSVDQVAPTLAHRFVGGDHSELIATPGIYDESNTAALPLLSFDGGTLIRTIPRASLPIVSAWAFRDELFWTGIGSGPVIDVGRWTRDGGSVDFIDYGLDPLHGAGSLGTDGVDMAWAEGHGKSGLTFATADYWTSPYVTDNGKLKRRRLRSAPPDAVGGASPFAVGCGRLASYTSAGAWIVRLSDGQGWLIPSGASWEWQWALAVTCDEVFLRVALRDAITIARVRFDQLGPGLLPD